MIKAKLTGSKLMFFLILGIMLPTKALRAQNALYTLDGTLQGVEYAHAVVSCNGDNKVLLKFTNTNNTAVTISWSGKFSTQEAPTFNANPQQGSQSLTLQPGSIYPANCQDQSQPSCIIDRNQVHPAYRPHIVDFQFYNVTVN